MTKTSFKTSLTTRLIRLASTIISIAATLLLTTSPALAQKPVSLQLNPPDAPNQTKTILSYEIKSTKNIDDVLTVRNTSLIDTYQFRVYPVDSIASNDGTGAYKLSDITQTTIGNWIKFNNQSTLSIKPGQTLLLPYKISIPEKSTPGIFKGGLIVELSTAPARPPELSPSVAPVAKDGYAKDEPAPSDEVKIVTRLVEPIIISIPGRKIANYNIDDFSYLETNGFPRFNLRFSNKGNMLLRADASLRVSGTLFQSPYEVSLNNAIILQDSNFDKTFLFVNPPLFGGYEANLVLNVYEYDINKDHFTLLNTINKSIRFSIIPYPCIFALLLLIILIIFAEKWRRKYLKDTALDTFIHRVTKDETLTSIADLYKINWKTIAKLNHLHRPYALDPGDELILPFPKP